MEHVFIVNPVAGRGKALKFISEIRGYFSGQNIKYTVKITKYPGHATEIAREYAKKGAKRIYSVGGDGTLNEVINGLADEDCSLGVIPGGSGNDFIRSITNDFNDIIDRTVKGSTKNIDAGMVNRRYFLNIASIGFDAQVVYTANRMKKFPLVGGRIAYTLGVFGSLFKAKSYKVDVNIDGNKTTKEILLIAIANGLYYGGGMKPVPSAKIDDGYLDVCIIDKKSFLDILRFFPKFIKGRHGDLQGVTFARCKNIEIASMGNIALNTDGETQLTDRVKFGIASGKISLIIPEER